MAAKDNGLGKTWHHSGNNKEQLNFGISLRYFIIRGALVTTLLCNIFLDEQSFCCREVQKTAQQEKHEFRTGVNSFL